MPSSSTRCISLVTSSTSHLKYCISTRPHLPHRGGRSKSSWPLGLPRFHSERSLPRRVTSSSTPSVRWLWFWLDRIMPESTDRKVNTWDPLRLAFPFTPKRCSVIFVILRLITTRMRTKSPYRVEICLSLHRNSSQAPARITRFKSRTLRVAQGF